MTFTHLVSDIIDLPMMVGMDCVACTLTKYIKSISQRHLLHHSSTITQRHNQREGNSPHATDDERKHFGCTDRKSSTDTPYNAPLVTFQCCISRQENDSEKNGPKDCSNVL